MSLELEAVQAGWERRRTLYLLTQLRLEHLPQQTLADDLGVSIRALQRWFRGLSALNKANLEKLVDFLSRDKKPVAREFISEVCLEVRRGQWDGETFRREVERLAAQLRRKGATPPAVTAELLSDHIRAEDQEDLMAELLHELSPSLSQSEGLRERLEKLGTKLFEEDFLAKKTSRPLRDMRTALQRAAQDVGCRLPLQQFLAHTNPDNIQLLVSELAARKLMRDVDPHGEGIEVIEDYLCTCEGRSLSTAVYCSRCDSKRPSELLGKDSPSSAGQKETAKKNPPPPSNPEVKVSPGQQWHELTLNLCLDGKSLWDGAVSSVMEIHYDLPAITDRAIARLIGAFTKSINDCLLIGDDLEIGDQLELQIFWGEQLDSLKNCGYLVYVARRRSRLEGGVGPPSAWPQSLISLQPLEDCVSPKPSETTEQPSTEQPEPSASAEPTLEEQVEEGLRFYRQRLEQAHTTEALVLLLDGIIGPHLLQYRHIKLKPLEDAIQTDGDQRADLVGRMAKLDPQELREAVEIAQLRGRLAKLDAGLASSHQRKACLEGIIEGLSSLGTEIAQRIQAEVIRTST